MSIWLLPIDKDTSSAGLADAFAGCPPEAHDAIEQTLVLLTKDPRPAPWGAYLALTEDAVVGTCAFKTPLRGDRSVEIAYMTFPPYEGRGYATAMVAALLIVAAEGRAGTVSAHTLREENASVRALKRNGFIFVRDILDPEDGLVWRWERRT